MKFRFEVECTPDETRQCLGLPNIAPLQDRILKQIEDRMQENLRYLDPEFLLKTWLPLPVQGWGEMQKIFWNQMASNLTPKKE